MSRSCVDLLGTLGLMALLALAPALIGNEYWRGVIVTSMYFAIVAGAWNLLAGYTGQFSLAPAGFALMGAYTAGLGWLHWHLPASIGIPAAIIIPGTAGLILGRLALRLRGPYFALTTLASAEILRVLISNSLNFTNGDLGITLPALFTHRLAAYYLILAVVTFTQLALAALLRTRAGLYLRAIRDDEPAAAARGVATTFWKILASGLSAALCGLAGALYGYFAGFVSPELGLISQSGLVLSMAVIGGLGSLTGPLAGALLIYLTSEALRGTGGWQLVIFAALLIIVARFCRQGLWGLVLDACSHFTAPRAAQLPLSDRKATATQ